MKNTIVFDVTPSGSCINRRIGGTYRMHHQDKNQRARNNVMVLQLPVTVIFVALMMEALRFLETSILTRSTRRNIPEDVILRGFICPK
jgi:hypothetical protein